MHGEGLKVSLGTIGDRNARDIIGFLYFRGVSDFFSSPCNIQTTVPSTSSFQQLSQTLPGRIRVLKFR